MGRKTKEQYREILEKAATLIGQISVNAENEKLDPVRVYNDLKIMMQVMDEGKVKIEVKRNYWVFWRNGSFDFGDGYSEADAFTRMGYGAGAQSACDFIMPVPYERDAVYSRITLPDSVKNDAELFGHYKAYIGMYIADLKKNGAPQDEIDDAIEEVQSNSDYIANIYPEREFTKQFAEMYRELFMKYGKLPTGFVELNEHLEGGLRPGDFTVISVPTSAGASTVSLDLVRDAAEEKKSDTPILDKLKIAMQHVPKDFLP